MSDSNLSQPATDTDSNLTLNELESHLFKCADLIRNTVDPTDYKDYILPLVFYKSFNDTYQDHYQNVLDEHGDDLPEDAVRDLVDFEYELPKGYSWTDLIEADNPATKVDQAFTEFERANEKHGLDKIASVSYATVEPFTTNDGNKLESLLTHLRDINLSQERVPPDMLGEAYMDLVKKFAAEEGKDGGEFFTPPKIVELIVRILEPYDKHTNVHDPTAGSGGMLVQVAEHLRNVQLADNPPEEVEDHLRTLRFTGQEINPTVYAIAQMNLAINNLVGDVRRGDSLSSPQFATDGEMDKFEYILANFPFSVDWDKKGLQDDSYNRFHWHDKLPRADRGDYAFIMHMVEQLADDGKAGIVIPHGVLFRKHEKRYRKPLLENDFVEAVIGLPENLFQNVSIPSAILVLNKDKPAEREGEVQFIHAADEAFYKELSNQNELTNTGLDHVESNFKNWSTEERVSRTVTLDEIAENDYNLNIALYVDTTEPQEPINVSEELQKLRQLQTEHEQLEQRFTNYMEELNYE